MPSSGVCYPYVHTVIDLCIKFEVPRFNLTKEMTKDPKFTNVVICGAIKVTQSRRQCHLLIDHIQLLIHIS